MSNKEEAIKQEIKDSLKAKGFGADELRTVDLELDAMELTEDAISQDSCLKKFYQIWKKRQGQTGNKNELSVWTAFYLGLTSQKPLGEFLHARRFFARARVTGRNCRN